MKKWGCCILISLLLVGLAVPVLAETPPDYVQEYAETKGFHTASDFISNGLNSDGKTLFLGDAHRKYTILYDEELIKHSNRLSDFIHESSDWVYTLDDSEGQAITMLTIHTKPELGQAGGRDARSFGQAMTLMKALIHNYGDTGEPIVLNWRTQYFIMYSFGGDERIISLVGTDALHRTYKSVESYLELPTGTELLEEITNFMEIDKNTPEGSYSGNATISLEAHTKVSQNRQIIIIIVVSIIATISIITVVVYQKTMTRIKRKRL